jgi:hypothetical protein
MYIKRTFYIFACLPYHNLVSLNEPKYFKEIKPEKKMYSDFKEIISNSIKLYGFYAIT